MSSTISGLNAYLFPNTLDNLTLSDEIGDNFLKLDGSNAMLADLDVGVHNIKNLADATTNDEAVNLGQLTSRLGNYVDLTTNQVVGGIKTISQALEATLQFNKPVSRYAYLRFLENNVFMWDMGIDAANNDFYWFNGTNTVMQLKRATGDLQIGTVSTSNKLTVDGDVYVTNLTPTVNNHLTSKFYVDSAISGGLTNYVDLTSTQFVGGSKIFTQSGNGYLSVNRANNTSNFAYMQFWTALANKWTAGMRDDSTDNFYFAKDNSIPLFNINYSLGYTEAINNISGINTGWSNTSPSTLNLGSSTKTGCLTLQGTTGYSTIQSTTNNLHLDTATNSGSGIYLNWYSSDANTFINSTAGSGNILAGGSTPNATYKMVIEKGTKTRALYVNGDTQINGELNMTNNKIINLGIPTSTNDAANKNYVDSNFVTLATNQSITGIKSISIPGAYSYLNINKATASDYGFIRYQSALTDIWDVGINPSNNYYWYYTPTALTAMTVTATGRLGIGTASPTDKLQVENGSMIMNRTDNLPCLLNMSTNSASSALGSVISLTSVGSRAAGIKLESSTNVNNKWFMGHPYVGGSVYDMRFVLGYVSTAGLDPAVEVTGGGVRQYTPLIAADGTNLRLGINTFTPLVPCHITGNTRISSGTLDMTTNKVINVADGTATADAINFGQWKNGKVLNVAANFTYANEDFIYLAAGLDRTITFTNLPNYYDGKRCELIVYNNGLFARVLTFTITVAGTFPDGTATKTVNIGAGVKKRFSIVIENLQMNNLYITELTYL